MTEKRTTFLDQHMAAICGQEEIDVFEEQWHQSESTASLAAYLGFTEDEYAQIAQHPALLKDILNARKRA